jgi:hypothetical protein
MIKIRITGLPDELECFLNELRKHFSVLNVSKPYQNSNSKFVRIYADVQEDKNNES